jgi:hypothetical protein
MQIVQIFSLVISFAFLIVLIDLIRRGLLKEKYSILWLASVFAIIVLSLWKDLMDRVAAFAGVAYGPSLLFLVAFACVLLILLHYSVVISILTERSKTLAQEIALLKAALKDGEKAEAEEEEE